jgi:glycerol-3-phosphate acyltransferase PlsY
MDGTVRPLLVICVAYLLGSIPFGYVIVRLKKGDDVRTIGSGGTGATNVSRRAGKAAGVATLLLDALKGAAAVLIAKVVLGWPVGLAYELVVRPHNYSQPMAPTVPDAYWWIAAAGVAAIVGHIFPVWLRFRGGKGVATGAGVFVVLAPIAVGFAAVIFLVIVWSTRYVSLGSIVAAATIPLFIWLQDAFIRPVGSPIPTMTAAAAAAILIIFAHRANMRRLIEGTENKFR